MSVKVIENGAPVIYRVNYGDTLDTIAKKFNIAKSYILEHNAIDKLEEGDRIYLPQTNIRVHIVAPLDSLSKISKKYGISEDEILKKNKIQTLFIGQKLYL